MMFFGENTNDKLITTVEVLFIVDKKGKYRPTYLSTLAEITRGSEETSAGRRKTRHCRHFHVRVQGKENISEILTNVFTR